MAYPGEDPNYTARSSRTAIWVRDDSPISTALMSNALSSLPKTQSLIAQIYYDTKDGSVALAIRSGDPNTGKLIATEFQQALWQAGAPGHGGIYVRAGWIADGIPLAMLDADCWAKAQPMSQAS